MTECVPDVLSGIRRFLSSMDGDRTQVTLTLFNQGTDVIYRNQPKENWIELTNKKYRPVGGTALMDAMGETIKMAEMHQPRLWSDQEENVVSIVVLTDGDENASKIYTPAHIADLVNHHRSQEWNFVFLGPVEERLFERADALNIPRSAVLAYTHETVDTAICSAANALNRMVSGHRRGMYFSREERAASNPSV